MSYKRSRSTFEADHHAPFATFGTPLPDEAESRDDGSYVPVWKQEVRDERGRKRLHGAFTGGWSAGYFNTVGSKEGWTPSTFVSSRSNRRKDGESRNQQRAEDFMDEEDLADAAEAQTLQTSQAFAGLGSSNAQQMNKSGLMGLFRPTDDTMGLKLLRKMGWKDGQGIGPKIRRSARLGLDGGKAGADNHTYLFAPEKAQMIQLVRKNDQKGLGHQGEAKLSTPKNGHDHADEEDDDDMNFGRTSKPTLDSSRKGKSKPGKGGIGVGILNDNGSDEEDPYEMGPKIRYNRVLGGDKKKKNKKAIASANPALGTAPVFVSKLARAGGGLRRCHDGRLPLDGFVLAKVTEDFTSLLSEYAPPVVPTGWTSSRNLQAADSAGQPYVSTGDAAKASKHDPKSRAAILGEQALPGKSIFDYISSSAREKLATASGRADLPPGLGEVHAEYVMSAEEKQKMLWDQVPKLDRDTALAAIARGSTGPYADDEDKRERYRSYLEHLATPERPLPIKPGGMSDDDYLREANEFYNCARIFRPMTGFMASRFTTGKSTVASGSGDGADGTDLLSKPEPKAEDPAEQAAKMGMFGQMTRSVTDFYPSRLLCKRFNIKPPANARMDKEPDNAASGSTGATEARPTFDATATRVPTGAGGTGDTSSRLNPVPLALPSHPGQGEEQEDKVQRDGMSAADGKPAHEDVLKAIFGDSDSE